jgi:hypothetical protein
MAVNYYINQTVLGGTPNPRYPDPLVTGAPNEYGLYPWSAFRARVSNIVDGEVVSLNATISAPYILLFISDEVSTGYFQDVATAAVESPLEPAPSAGFFLDAPAGSVVTRPAGQVASGYVATGTANIATTGFMATGIAGITADATNLIVFANSPNICSPISFQNWDTVDTATAKASGALPIILLYSSYTQAIRDAGNIFVATAGGATGATYQVVGLIDPDPPR